MVHVTPFLIDQWIDKHKADATLQLSSSCVSPLTIRELEQLSDDPNLPPPIPLDRPMSYGAPLGSQRLRENIAALYGAPVTREDVLVTQGTISANFLLLDTLCGPGDHVICQYPTYQQLFDVPRHAGADVTLWKVKAENGFVPSITDLAGMVQENTKLLIINNPCNPTGATLSRSFLENLVSFAAKRNITILSDEVFRPLFHELSPTDPEYPPSILSMAYKNVVVTGSVSKGYSFPGIRIGWIVSPMPDIIHAAVLANDYTTISVSQLDDSVATFVLEPPVRAKILERSFQIIKRNLAVLEAFVDEHKWACSWVKPAGGAVAFVKVVGRDGKPVDDDAFCQDLVKKTGTLIIPAGLTFGTDGPEEYRGYVRIGFVSDPETLVKGLASIGRYLKEECS